MNHLESSFIGKNIWWRYVIVMVAVFALTNTIGAIPLLISIGISAANDPSILEKLSGNPNDLSVLGINPNLYLVEMIFPFIIGLIAFVMLLYPMNGKKFRHVLVGTGAFRWNRLIVSAVLWALFSAIYLFASIKLDPSNYSLHNTSKTLIPLIFISVLLIPFQAAWEEIIFRGYLMQGFTVLMKSRWVPVIFTSILFALMHVINPEVKEYGFWSMMPQYLLFGLVFGIITVMDDGVEAAIGAHAANNAFLAVMLTNKSSVLQTPSVYEQHVYNPGIEFLTMLVMGIVILVVMKLLFKWKGFSALFKKVEPDNSIVQIP